jgi:putative hydrolase of the HAD superfamily
MAGFPLMPLRGRLSCPDLRRIGHDAGMAGPVTTHVLLDFFGTLVGYSPSRTLQGYHASHALVGSMGAQISYEQFLQAWADESALFDERSAIDDSEFSMDEVAVGLLTRVLGHDPDHAQTAALVEAYLSEWNTAVVYPPGVADLVGALADRFRLAVVTNTHQADLVAAHLSAMGIAGLFEAVVTSVEVGWRKPHPAIYTAALECLGITAGNAVFVGDSFIADYAGPTAVGLTAFLIDPDQQHSVPPGRRLSSLHELPAHLKIYMTDNRG